MARARDIRRRGAGLGLAILGAGSLLLGIRSLTTPVSTAAPAPPPTEPPAGEPIAAEGSKAQSLWEAGDEYRLEGEIELAIEKFKEAVAVADAEGPREILADALNSLGVIHKGLGDYYRALTRYSRALGIADELGDTNRRAEALHNIGSCYSFLGELEAALVKHGDAQEAWPSPYEKSISKTAIGTIYDLQGRHDEAISELRDAFTLRHADPERHPVTLKQGKAATLDRLASAYRNAGRLEEARRAYQSALGLLEEIGYWPDYAVTMSNLGWLALDFEQPETALEHFSRALPILEEKRPHAVAHALLGTARAHRLKGDLPTAVGEIDKAVEIVESLRLSSQSQWLRATFFARRQPAFYELYIEVLMQLYETGDDPEAAARALDLSERFKARSLLDLLNEERSVLRRGADAAFLDAEERLHREMSAADHHRLELLHHRAPPEEIAEVEKEQRELTLLYEELKAGLRSKLPRTDTDPKPLDRRAMQKLLDEETLLLHYALGEERSFLWAVSREEIRPFVLPPRQEIEELAQQTFDWLKRSDQRSGSGGRAAGAKLSEVLLGQVGSARQGRRLLVVADGLLHYIPFAALPRPGGTVEDAPLVLDHEIVTLPSVSVLATLRRRAAARDSPPGKLAVVADPLVGPDDPRFTAARRNPSKAGQPSGVRGAVPPLPAPERLEHSAEEAAAILDLVAPDERLDLRGIHATREAVLGGELARYRFVHFAVHGKLYEDQPEYTHLVLSLADAEGHPRDGRLYMHELWELSLPADLVVLSACNSALGKHVRGEGLMGMTRGLMDAGASRVLVSLWFVNDEATTELMKKFYRELIVEGLRPAAALRSAQLWMRQQPRWQAPYYWAGFVLQGEWR